MLSSRSFVLWLTTQLSFLDLKKYLQWMITINTSRISFFWLSLIKLKDFTPEVFVTLSNFMTLWCSADQSILLVSFSFAWQTRASIQKGEFIRSQKRLGNWKEFELVKKENYILFINSKLTKSWYSTWQDKKNTRDSKTKPESHSNFNNILNSSSLVK